MDSIKSLLKKRIEEKKTASEESSVEFEKTVDNLFEKYYKTWKGDKDNTKLSYDKIPRFYFKTSHSSDILQQKLREEARLSFYNKRSALSLDNNELKTLWALLEQNYTVKKNEDEKMISYEDFLKVKQLAGPKCHPFFTASLFTKLQQNDAQNHISITALFNYAMRKTWFDQTRIGLSLYDAIGQGYLRETDLDNYILDLIPTLPLLEGLEETFHSFYVCTAVRKFFFFLDPLRTGRIRILDILISNFLDDLLQLRDETVSKEDQEQNWFSAASALRVYGQYLNLDKDHNGMLNKQELSGYGKKTLTAPFLDRVFQECMTFDGEMDYKNYLDFVLALENRFEPQSLHYFFKVLDIDAKGYLTPMDINFFFRAIQEQAGPNNTSEMVSVEDVITDIFDMVKPAHPDRITLQDLLSSPKGGTAVNMLIDYHGFLAFENRESVTTEQSSSVFLSSYLPSFTLSDTEPDMATEYMSDIAQQI